MAIDPKQARIRLGLTQQAMADAMGLTSKHTWIKWERGERAPSAAARQMMYVLLYIQELGQLDNFLARHTIIV
jgi:transcriptional regulator with XRE-family HTH domain